MNQQEFEPEDMQAYEAQDDRRSAEARPKDEPPGAYDMPAGQFGRRSYREYRARQAQVPWWARPQPRQAGGSSFALVVAILVLIVVLMGGLGIAGVVLGALAHLIGILLGAIFALFIFLLVLMLLVMLLIRRALRRLTGYDPRRARRRF